MQGETARSISAGLRPLVESCPESRRWIYAPALLSSSALVPALGTADAVILVDLDDIAAHPSGDLAQLSLLIDRGLIDSGNSQIQNVPFHRQLQTGAEYWDGAGSNLRAESVLLTA